MRRRVRRRLQALGPVLAGRARGAAAVAGGAGSRWLWSLPVPDGDEGTKTLYVRRHLPQGAPTSPALANLSAFGLDVRLSGLLKKFGGNYTRYADDLTLSGPDDFRYALRCVIPLTEQIVRSERFRLNHRMRKVIRRGHRQLVTGVVVNDKHDWRGVRHR